MIHTKWRPKPSKWENRQIIIETKLLCIFNLQRDLYTKHNLQHLHQVCHTYFIYKVTNLPKFAVCKKHFIELHEHFRGDTRNEAICWFTAAPIGRNKLVSDWLTQGSLLKSWASDFQNSVFDNNFENQFSRHINNFFNRTCYFSEAYKWFLQKLQKITLK